MHIFPFFYNLAILLFSEIEIYMINWQQDFVPSNLVCIYTCDELARSSDFVTTCMITYQIGLHSRQSYYHHLSQLMFMPKKLEISPQLF